MNQKRTSTLQTKIKRASQELGVEETELMDNAITFYLDNLSPYLGLRNELAAWDRLANEALAKSERGL